MQEEHRENDPLQNTGQSQKAGNSVTFQGWHLIDTQSFPPIIQCWSVFRQDV